LFEIFLILVTNVISPDKKAGQPLRNLIGHALERLRMKMHSVAENAALRVITGFDEL
jgi:hypothetical protein